MLTRIRAGAPLKRTSAPIQQNSLSSRLRPELASGAPNCNRIDAGKQGDPRSASRSRDTSRTGGGAAFREDGEHRTNQARAAGTTEGKQQSPLPSRNHDGRSGRRDYSSRETIRHRSDRNGNPRTQGVAPFRSGKRGRACHTGSAVPGARNQGESSSTEIIGEAKTEIAGNVVQGCKPQ